MKPSSWLAPLVALALGLPAPLPAQLHSLNQKPPIHESFWGDGTVGAGWARRTCDQCPDPLETWGGFASGEAGGTIRDNFLLGGEFAAWYRKSGGVKTLIANGSVTATWFPIYRKGLFLKGGGGFSVYQYRQNGATLKGVGPGLVGQIGYDIMVGRHTALAPTAGIWWGLPGALKRKKGGPASGVSPASGAKYTVLLAGLKLTFY